MMPGSSMFLHIRPCLSVLLVAAAPLAASSDTARLYAALRGQWLYAPGLRKYILGGKHRAVLHGMCSTDPDLRAAAKRVADDMLVRSDVLVRGYIALSSGGDKLVAWVRDDAAFCILNEHRGRYQWQPTIVVICDLPRSLTDGAEIPQYTPLLYGGALRWQTKSGARSAQTWFALRAAEPTESEFAAWLAQTERREFSVWQWQRKSRLERQSYIRRGKRRWRRVRVRYWALIEKKISR